MDRVEFERLVGPERRALLAHCHRMLGSNADAEDALQETLVRAWTGIDKWEKPFQHIGILSLEFHVDKLSRPLL